MPTASTAKLIIPPLPQNNKNRAFARFFVYGRAEATYSVNSQKIYAISADYRLPRAGKYVMMGKMIYIEQKEGKTYGTESQRFSK